MYEIETIKAVCRVWKTGNKNPILLFPESIDRRQYQIMMYEIVGQHGYGDHHGVVQMTRLATDEEAAEMAKHYEDYYRCKIKLMKKLKINWSQDEPLMTANVYA